MNIIYSIRSLTILAVVVVAGGLALIAAGAIVFAPAHASNSSAPTHETTTDSKVYMPFISSDYNPVLGTRMGFGAGGDPGVFPNIRDLNAGWYVDWGHSSNPSRPAGMEYVQMLRIHQKVTCGSRVTADRVACAYVQPYSYELGGQGNLNLDDIKLVAQQQPGSTWLIGNECDRRDWQNGGQDEILPEVYIDLYHNVYNALKAADSTSKIAICGIIQPTPLRMQYISAIWDLYNAKYGPMPVDIWNVHNFALREVAGEWGADIPPGNNAQQGAYLGEHPHSYHIDQAVFDSQIRVFRQWMKDRGQQNKPLIVTEYGVLFDWFTEQQTHDFMLFTFDYFLNTKDCALSTHDDCRLVQRWAWFSLNDIGWGFNPHGTLFNTNGGNILPAGEKYRDFVRNNIQELHDYNP